MPFINSYNNIVCPFLVYFFDGIYVKIKETNKLLISVPPIFRYFNQSQQYV